MPAVDVGIIYDLPFREASLVRYLALHPQSDRLQFQYLPAEAKEVGKVAFVEEMWDSNLRPLQNCFRLQVLKLLNETSSRRAGRRKRGFFNRKGKILGPE